MFSYGRGFLFPAYFKFSIYNCSVGDPDVISKVPGRKDLNYLENWSDSENLQLLNLTYVS